MRELWGLAGKLFQNEVARERSYVLRRYQIRAAMRAVAAAIAGRNAAIELPTGTGKTLIACLAAIFWKRIRPTSRVLFIVPSRTLVVQHFDVAFWIAQALTVDRLTDQQSGDPGSLRRTVLRSDLLISMPGILAGGLGRGIAEKSVVESFDFIIADEFDQFVVISEDDRQSVGRYAEHWQRLTAILRRDARYLLKSATLGIEPNKNRNQRQTRADRRSRLIKEFLRPIPIMVPEQCYRAVIPFKPILEVQLHDPNIDLLLKAVSVSKGKAHLRLEEAIGSVDYSDVERRAPHLCDGPDDRSVQLRTGIHGPMRTVIISASIRRAFCRITSLMMMPQHIVEDLTLGLNVSYADTFIKTSTNEVVFVQEAPVLQDNRDDARFHFQAGFKADALRMLVEARGRQGERGVIFVRTITLLEGLKPILTTIGLPLFELTGTKSDHERRVAVASFRESRGGILLMTRTTGGRGLDLPFAHYSVFYSPKTEPTTMWQEMSRIRSTVSSPKDIHVLCYTDEIGPLHDLVTALIQQRRRVSCMVLDIL